MSKSVYDIFISYSSKDHIWVAQLAQAFNKCGFSVWWDRELVAGDNFYQEIKKALDQSRCVVTVWSKHSVESEWVLGETSQAAKRRILVPVVYREAVISPAFHALHNADLRNWQGDVDEDEFQELLRGIVRVLQKHTPDLSLVTNNLPQPPKKLLGSKEHMKYWMAAGAFLTILAIIFSIRADQKPQEPTIKGDCSGDFSGDISGTVLNINCSKKN